MLTRRAVAWAFVSDCVALYPLYALLFADSGLSPARISVLFAVWSAVSFVAEVPTGALADRYSRRGCLAAAGVLHGAGFGLWVAVPRWPGFLAGFVLWGLAGTLTSGALEALLHDTLAAHGAAARFPAVLARVTSASLAGQLGSTIAGAALFATGGYAAAGAASVLACLAAAVLAARLPDLRPPSSRDEQGLPAQGLPAQGLPTQGLPTQGQSAHGLPAPGPPTQGPPTQGPPAHGLPMPGLPAEAPPAQDPPTPGYLATLAAGVTEVARTPLLRRAVVALALVTGLDAAEEYLGLLVRSWGVGTSLTPVALLVVQAAAAIGAGCAPRLRRPALVMAVSGVLLVAAAVLARPGAVLPLAAWYGGYRAVLVVVSAALQARIQGAARATATSVAALATEVVVLAVYALWAAGGPLGTALATLVIAVTLPRLLPRA